METAFCMKRLIKPIVEPKGFIFLPKKERKCFYVHEKQSAS